MRDEVPPSADGKSEASDVATHLAYAEAAVMLVECLMLVLMEKKVLPLESLTQAVEAAIEAKQGLVKEGAHPQIAVIAAGVLSRIANSLAALEHGSNERHAAE
jgi:hypothetical protein